MNKRIEQLQQWIMKRSKRQKIYLFLMSLIVIYYIWNLIFIKPIVLEQSHLKNQIAAFQTESAAIEQQYAVIEKIINSETFISVSKQQQQLISQRKNVKEKIAKFTPVFVAENDFAKLTNDILQQLNKTIVLISLKEFADQPWEAPEVDKSVIMVKNIYQHKIAIEFRSNYFDALSFISRLEKLPWHLYWDKLEYKVTKYPEADVTVQIYVLSNR